jgi:hypothetical protein
MVKKYVSQFQLMMHLTSGRAVNVISFKHDDSDAGLYVAGSQNRDFHTSLLARGPKAELEALVKEHSA